MLIYFSGFISLFLIIYYIYISNYNKNILKQNERRINFLMMQQQRVSNYLDGTGRNPQMKQQQKEILKQISEQKAKASPIIPEKYDERVVKNRVIQEKVKMMSQNANPPRADASQEVFSMEKDMLIYNRTVQNIHIFYYLPVKWYKNHNTSDFPVLDTVFHPSRGFYNLTTIDLARKVIREHFEEIRLCGIGTIIINWEPNNGTMNELIKLAFMIAHEMNEKRDHDKLKITFQIDDYRDRTIESIRTDIKFFVDNFTGSPSLLKVHSTKKLKALPLIYVKHAKLVKDWGKLLAKNGLLTIRNTNYDCLILAHLE